MRPRTAVAGPIVSIVCTLTLFGTALPHSATAAESFPGCRIASVEGRAQLKNANGARPAKPGEPIVNADTVITGQSGRVHIKCGERASFTVGTHSQIVFEKLLRAAETESLIVRISRGIAGFVVTLLGRDRFEVHTPSAVASVRSTEWTVDATRKGTAVFVRKGAVNVAGSRGTGSGARLQAGEGVDVGRDGTVSTVRSWGQTRIQRMNDRLGFDWK